MIGLKNDEGTNEQQNGRETFNAQHSTLNVQGNGRAMSESMNERVDERGAKLFFELDSHCPSDLLKSGAG